MSMTPFRRIALDGPDLSGDERIWEAMINLGFPFDAGAESPVLRNHSIRLLVQTADTISATIVGEPSFGVKTAALLHQPLLLAAAATTVDFGPADSAAVIEILSASFEPVRLIDDEASPRYSELHVMPRDGWPDGPFEKDKDGKFQIVAPRLRATSGAIRVGYANPGQHGSASLTKRLAMDWTPLGGQRVRIFSNLEIGTVETLGKLGTPPKKARAIAVELVPEGVEFDLRVPDPFGSSIAPSLDLRLRLVAIRRANRSEARLDLVGGSAASLKRLSEGLAWMARDLTARGGNLVLQVDSRGIPPLSWPLTYDKSAKAYSCGKPGMIPEVSLREEGVSVKVLTRPDSGGGEPGVAELIRHRARLAERDPAGKLTLLVDSVSDEPPAPATGPTVTLTWGNPSPTSRPFTNPDIVATTGFKGVAAMDALGARLSRIWSRSGAIPLDAWPPYAFIALDRGWAQLPLMDAPKPGAVTTRRAAKGPPAFAGLMRVDVPLSSGTLPHDLTADGTELPGLSLMASSRVSVVVTWIKPLDQIAERAIKIAIEDSFGVLDGLLWAGEASPSPVEILPPRDAGPAALHGIPIVFGGRDTVGWNVNVGAVTKASTCEISFPLPVVARKDAGPALIWQPHHTLALVSAVAMTRTAESATRPSPTRELVPSQVPVNGELKFVIGNDGRLPSVVLPAGSTVHGDGQWHWPWPPASAEPGISAASPRERAGVALAALTLPGIEFTLGPSAAAPMWDESLLASLRFDLPILDELFANAKAPQTNVGPAKKQEVPVPEAPPTALNLRRLSDTWLENARRIARARTEADRVVLQDRMVDKKVTEVLVWHPSTKETNGVVRGLVDPYVWEPDAFVISLARPEQKANLGAYCLGQPNQEQDWYAGAKAIGGLTVSFKIDGGTLLPGGTDVRIDGFASSSFKAKPRPENDGDADQLHDARGLSLALDPKPLTTAMTAREVSLRKAPDDRRFSLATLRQPISLKIGKQALKFWFRDLPVREEGRFVFDGFGGLETSCGPDPEALGRNRAAAALYEWRFYPEVAAGEPGRFEIPLAGPLVARPLRLLAFEMNADGTPALLEVLSSVGLAGTEPSENQKGDMVFAAEEIAASGNLAVLRFDDEKDGFAFRAIRQVTVGDSNELTITDSTRELSFRADGEFIPRSTPAATTPIKLGLRLQVAESGDVDIGAASLELRLFGQACRLDLEDAHFKDDAIKASCAGNPGDSPLQLKEIELNWPKSGAPEITLKSAQLRASLRLNDPQSPMAFVRDYGADDMRWLGLTTELPPSVEEVDHDAGVVRIQFDQPIEGAELFRGFLLPPGRLYFTVAFVLTRTSSGSVVAWPQAKLGSAYLEFGFDATHAGTTQRVTSIRHRHVGRSDPKPAWESSLRLDADFGAMRRSTIQWPIGHAAVAKATFDPHPGQKTEWTTTLTMDPGSGFDLVHEVQPRICAHNLSLGLLAQDGAVTRLRAPWRFRAVVQHSLSPAEGQVWPGTKTSAQLTWASLDEICLIDLHSLASDAIEEFRPATRDTEYAFMARYKGDDANIRVAGVVRRALANAGFPVRAILSAVRSKFPTAESLAQVPPALVLTGACLTEVVTGTRPRGLQGMIEVGVSIVPQWILPWAQVKTDTPSISPLDHCPQIAADVRTYKIAAHDAAAGAPRDLDGAAPRTFSAQDGTQSLVEARFAAIVGAAEPDEARATIAVDQAFIEGGEPSGNPLETPLFPRTLLALRSVAEAFSKVSDSPEFGRGMRCITSSVDVPHREIRFTVSIWPQNPAQEQAPQPAVTLLVADERRVSAEILPVALAVALSDPGSNALAFQGAQRAEAALRAFSLSATPLVVLLARVDTSYLTIHDKRPVADASTERTSIVDPSVPFPHVDWTFARVVAPGLVGQPSVPLRERDVTIYASPALGWPTDRRNGELAQVHARLGDEEVRRNTERAWAGRVRSLSWPAHAAGLDPKTPTSERETEEVANAVFIAMGQRAAFRRRAAKNLRSPPDRHAVLASPRARVPTIEALTVAFRESRIPVAGETDEKDRSRLAPLLPGQVEVTATGQRPGVLFMQHEGVLLSWAGKPFDPDFARFGRPAARGPLILRQLRAPRSSKLPDDVELELRRQTFVASDERDPASADKLKLMKLITGVGIVARFDRLLDVSDSALNPRSVTLTVDSPTLGCLTSAWNNRIRLVATVPGDIPARVALARIGLLPPAQNTPMSHPPHAVLQVGDALVGFEQMIWGETIKDDQPDGTPEARQLRLDFVIAATGALDMAQSNILSALRDASADTPIRFTLRCGTPIKPTDAIAGPEAYGKLALASAGRPGAADEDLIPGPPQILVFDLPYVPARRRWLQLTRCTVGFGDPAYDRELGSPAQSGALGIDNVPHVLAADRADYDPSATIHFAFWKRERKQGADALAPSERQWTLSLQVVPLAGGKARDLAIAATSAAGTQYKVRGLTGYAIAIANLRETLDGKPLPDQPARLVPGDRLKLTVSGRGADNVEYDIAVDIGIVAEPVLPPPAASYGLATLERGGPAVGTALFATAPLPQKIDFPDLVNDLVAGHVRRRALFLWPFVTSSPPPDGKPFAYLVKFDRTGGGQLPESRADFVIPE